MVDIPLWLSREVGPTVGVIWFRMLDRFKYTRRRLRGYPSSDTCHNPTKDITISVYLAQEAAKRTEVGQM